MTKYIKEWAKFEEEDDDTDFDLDEIKKLKSNGFVEVDSNKYCMPGMDSMYIEITKNKHEDGHIYYRILINGRWPQNPQGVNIYAKRFRNFDQSIRRLDNDMDGIIVELTNLLNNL